MTNRVELTEEERRHFYNLYYRNVPMMALGPKGSVPVNPREAEQYMAEKLEEARRKKEEWLRG